jgi:hypothetical protein
MTRLDPAELFDRIANDIPESLHSHLIVTGSLAAAYEFHAQLEGQAVNTKDADLVVHPAGEEKNCAEMTQNLLQLGWTPTEQCFPHADPEPIDDLCAIRLYPPNSSDYFIEFLNVPAIGQETAKKWIPLELADGWYGLPSFRYMGVVALGPLKSKAGIEYANPAMMALANLLAHPRVGDSRIESGTMEGVLRSAKDLGRVIALAHLAGRDETENWITPWISAIETCFPNNKRDLVSTLGEGLRDLIDDPAALEDAHKTTDIGLLSGMNVTPQNLTVTAERLIVDVIEPVREASQ